MLSDYQKQRSCVTTVTASASGVAPRTSVTQRMVLVGDGADLDQLCCNGTAFVYLPTYAYCPALISTSLVTEIRLFSLCCS